MNRDELKAKADELGIEYKKNIKTDKLEELINNAEPIVAAKEPEEKEIVVAEVVADYYENHPRRVIKLRGLLSRTFDPKERAKIISILNSI